MNHVSHILDTLDRYLNEEVDLTIYGRAALALGFDPPPIGTEMTLDVDAVLWIGQAEQLLAETNLWEALDKTNLELARQGLYVSHFFTEEQVVLRTEWKRLRLPIPGVRQHLKLSRLADEDLLLSKLMRDDPLDRSDAQFLVRHNGWSRDEVQVLFSRARIPDIPELREQFAICCEKLLKEMA